MEHEDLPRAGKAQSLSEIAGDPGGTARRPWLSSRGCAFVCELLQESDQCAPLGRPELGPARAERHNSVWRGTNR